MSRHSRHTFYCVVAGISSWGRKVGRRLELLTISDGETLTYNVTPSSRPAAYSRSSTPDPGLVLDLNNNPGPGPGLVPAKQEMRERPVSSLQV